MRMAVVKTIRPYPNAAGGWGALKAMGEALIKQRIPLDGMATLAHMNQPGGFDCPGCAWPDPKHTSSFEYCENGGNKICQQQKPMAPGPITSEDTEIYILSIIDETPTSDTLSLTAAATIAGITSSARSTIIG
jgi:hypothetical protein